MAPNTCFNSFASCSSNCQYFVLSPVESGQKIPQATPQFAYEHEESKHTTSVSYPCHRMILRNGIALLLGPANDVVVRNLFL